MKDATGKKVKAEFSLAAIQNNTTTRKALEGFISEIEAFKHSIKSKQSSMRDIYKQAKMELGIPSKMLNKLVQEQMDPGRLEAEVRDLDEIKAVADVIDPPKAEFDA